MWITVKQVFELDPEEHVLKTLSYSAAIGERRDVEIAARFGGAEEMRQTVEKMQALLHAE